MSSLPIRVILNMDSEINRSVKFTIMVKRSLVSTMLNPSGRLFVCPKPHVLGVLMIVFVLKTQAFKSSLIVNNTWTWFQAKIDGTLEIYFSWWYMMCCKYLGKGMQGWGYGVHEYSLMDSWAIICTAFRMIFMYIWYMVNWFIQ